MSKAVMVRKVTGEIVWKQDEDVLIASQKRTATDMLLTGATLVQQPDQDKAMDCPNEGTGGNHEQQ